MEVNWTKGLDRMMGLDTDRWGNDRKDVRTGGKVGERDRYERTDARQTDSYAHYDRQGRLAGEDETPSAEKGGESPEDEGTTREDVVVNPDGSKVLVITMQAGGMETTMSVEIAKPTDNLLDTGGASAKNPARDISQGEAPAEEAFSGEEFSGE